MNKTENATIDVTSEQVEDILGRAPSWIIRWGSLYLLLILLLFFSIAGFLKYPTIISGDLKLTTKEQPVKVVSKAPGKVEKIYADKITVKQGDKLALIENPLASGNIEGLQRTIMNVYSFLNGKKNKVEFYNGALGYLQGDFNTLRKKFVEYQFFKNNEYYASRMQRLNDQIKHTSNLINIAHKELDLKSVEVKNNEEKFKVEGKLFESQVTSRIDYLKAENDFVKQQQENQALKRRIEELNLAGLEYKRQLDDATFELRQKELDFTESIKQSLKLLESSILNWQQNYVIKAPIAGKALVLNSIVEKQHVNNNDAVFIIIPPVQRFIGFIDIPAKGFGKIKNGQRVRIKLHNYPSFEFGQLSGKVIDVPEIPIEDKSTSRGMYYRVIVDIDDKAKTSYNRILPFNAEMSGIGEIITKDQTLLERIFNQVRGRVEN